MEREIIGYMCEPETIAALRRVKDKLFGDGSRLTEDERRDLANLMAVLMSESRLFPVFSNEQTKEG